MTTVLALAESGLPAKCSCGKRLFKRLPQLKGGTFVLLDGGKAATPAPPLREVKEEKSSYPRCPKCGSELGEIGENTIMVACRKCGEVVSVRT